MPTRETHSQCDNCTLVVENSKLREAKDLSQRVDPGGPLPTGECPSCGALCYPFERFAKRTVLATRGDAAEFSWSKFEEADRKRLPNKCRRTDIGYDSQAPNNDERAEQAFQAVAKFAEVTETNLFTEGLESPLADLLANLAHLCDRTGLDLQQLLGTARLHYGAETQDKGSQFTPSN